MNCRRDRHPHRRAPAHSPTRCQPASPGCASASPYFFAGVAKLLAGPEWGFSDNVKFLLYRLWSDRRRAENPETRSGSYMSA